MKFWVPVAAVAVVVVAYAFFYLETVRQAGGASFGLANSLGLASVFVALVGAGLIIKRARPHQ